MASIGVARILLVGRSDGGALAEVLEAAGYRVEKPGTSTEALSLLMARPAELVLLPARLGGESGLRLCHLLKAAPAVRYTPVVILDDADSLDQRAEAVSAGADGYLREPIDRRELLAKVQVLVRLGRAERELATLLARERARSEVLADLNAATAMPRRLDGVLEAIVHAAVPAIADHALIALVEDGVFRHVHIINADPEAAAQVRTLLEGSRPGGMAARALAAQEIQHSDDVPAMVATDGWDSTTAAAFARLGVKRALAIPLLDRAAKPIALLGLGMVESDRLLGEEETALAEELAWRAGSAIEGALLHQRLEQTAATFRMVLEQMPSAVVIADPATGRITLANDRAAALGIDGRTASPRPVRLVDGEDRPIPPEREPMARALRGEKVVNEQVRVLGEQADAWVRLSCAPVRNAAGETIAAVAIFDDITDEHRLAAEHAAAERRTKRLEDTATALTAAATEQEVADALRDHALTGLGASCGIVGLVRPKSGCVEIASSFSVHPQVLRDRSRLDRAVDAPFTRVVRTGAPLWLHSRAAFEAEFPADHGFFAHHAFASAPMLLGDQVLGMLALSFDAPALLDDAMRETLVALAHLAAQAFGRVQLYEEERAARAESERLAALQKQFLAVVGHDLRNPLQAISMAAATLQRSADASAPSTRIVNRIATTAARMSEMISALLDFSSVSLAGGFELHPRQMDLAVAVRDLVEEHALTARQRIVTQLPEQAPGVWDQGRISQVVSNLVGNALKHGDPNTPVVVTLDTASDQVIFRVENEGQPIAPAFMPDLFQPFRRGGSRAEGLGLGLYIACSIVTAHGGRIDATSSEAGHTAFEVKLPRAIRDTPAR